MMKFRERFMMGEVPFDDIFSLTDKWNFSDEACTLREYLALLPKKKMCGSATVTMPWKN